MGELSFEESVVKRRNWVSVNHGGDGGRNGGKINGGFYIGN